MCTHMQGPKGPKAQKGPGEAGGREGLKPPAHPTH